MKYAFGLHKSPSDPQDHLVRSYLAPLKLPVSYNRVSEQSPVKNQGPEGACAGFMGIGLKEYQERKEWSEVFDLSERFIYEEAKKISGHSEGTTLKAIAQVLKERGAPSEAYWPYVPKVPGKPTGIPTEFFKINRYARVLNLTELKQAIVDDNIGVVGIGVYVYKGMISDQAKKTGVVPDPSCFDVWKPLGGHALLCVGYNDNSPYYKNTGHVICKNSWGEGFGDNGYIYLSYKYINNHMLDAFSAVDVIDDKNVHLLKLAYLGYEERKTAWI